MKILNVIVLAGVLFMLSCSQGPEKKAEEVPQVAAETVETEHHHDENAAIELNNGAKWKVAEHMMAFLRLMETDVKNFSKVQNPVMKDYNSLGENLQRNTDSLTSNCTMTGKAHDELHKWLLPYLDMVDELNQTKNGQEAASVYAKIEVAYTEFNKYFE